MTYKSVSRKREEQEKTFKDWIDHRGSTSHGSIRNFIPKDIDSVVSDLHFDKIKSVPANRQRLR